MNDSQEVSDQSEDLQLAQQEQRLPENILQRMRRGALKTGFTTGTCAAAATKAALLALVSEVNASQVVVSLPKGNQMSLNISWTKKSDANTATAAVIKNAGDDPDVTHGAEICSTVTLTQNAGIISIDGGKGVGRITKPGIGIGIGMPAINPGPLKMIQVAAKEVVSGWLQQGGVEIVISVPLGEEIAVKTDNPRLGILGGISILGTTGIVLPYSTASFAAAIRQALDVARAMGNSWVILTTGGRSEDYAKGLFGDTLPEHCFIQMGDFAGYSIKNCVLKQIRKVTIAGFVGKLTKMAMGIKQTHVRGSHVDMEFMAKIATDCFPGIQSSLIEEIRKANTARHVSEIVKAQQIPGFFELICKKVHEQMQEHSKGALLIEVIMFDFDGKICGRFAG
jgi:cobalt-precorrin-5B (C1)-methyltransferase